MQLVFGSYVPWHTHVYTPSALTTHTPWPSQSPVLFVAGFVAHVSPSHPQPHAHAPVFSHMPWPLQPVPEPTGLQPGVGASVGAVGVGVGLWVGAGLSWKGKAIRRGNEKSSPIAVHALRTV